MTRRELHAAMHDVGRLCVEWALAVQRGDPDAASYLGSAKAAALAVALPELQLLLPPATSPATRAGGAR